MSTYLPKRVKIQISFFFLNFHLTLLVPMCCILK